jgi:hypothetical protein
MALPSKSDVFALRFSKGGGPWCRATAKDSIDVSGLNYSLDGSPWGTASLSSAAAFTLYLGSTCITKIYLASSPITTFHITPP